MKFFIDHHPKPSPHPIDHSDKLFLIGSCFAENIGNKLNEHYFKTRVNPNGILFNPSSICQALVDCVENKETTTDLILKRDALFFSYLHHSSIYSQTKEDLQTTLTTIKKETHHFLKEAEFLVITFGTAYIYKHKELNRTVANCHKQAANCFEKRLLSVEEIVSDHNALLSLLKKFNPKLKIIFTISPVKYLKDGVEENSISKATLLLAVHQLCKQEHCHYFPAYELVSDDLRDYRFYKEDLAHPNQQAINYVWEKFSATFFTAETQQLNKELLSIHHSENHKFLHPESDEARKFLADLENKKRELKKKYSLGF